MKTIGIESHFRSGGTLWQWDGSKFALMRRAKECTWSDDQDTSFTVEVDDYFRGAITGWHGDGPHTDVLSVEFLGFSESELSAPAPVTGWHAHVLGVACTESTRVDSFQTYWSAELTGQFISDAEMLASGEIRGRWTLCQLPYEWGSQAAESFAVYRDGVFQRQVTGCGDNTPEPEWTGDGWSFTTEMERRMDAIHQEDLLTAAAREAAGNFRGGQILAHLRSSYGLGQNPLPTLRRRVGGRWSFQATAENAVDPGVLAFVQHDPPDGSAGYGWQVIYRP